MKVKIISVGTEVLTGLTVNTNAAYIGNRLTEEGYKVNKACVVADDRFELFNELENSSEDLIILTGGLGPTIDDFTKEVVSKHCQIRLIHSEEILMKIEDRFQKYNVQMDKSNYQQALVFEGQTIINNDNGTAPGFLIEGHPKYILLPGPPKEMIPMFEAVLADYLTLDKELYHLGYKLVGIGESSCEGLLRGFYEQHSNVEVAPYALDGEIKYILRSDDSEALKKCAVAFKKLFKNYIIGDYKTTLYNEVLKQLVDKELQVSFAESCTGGFAVNKLVELSGSSKVLNEAIVTYGNEAKMKYLNVKQETLEEFGAVSYQCAKEMALGLKDNTNADALVAITGIAGPMGGSEEKPVGLVYIAVLLGDDLVIEECNFNGNRTYVRERATHKAYQILFKLLTK